MRLTLPADPIQFFSLLNIALNPTLSMMMLTMSTSDPEKTPSGVMGNFTNGGLLIGMLMLYC